MFKASDTMGSSANGLKHTAIGKNRKSEVGTKRRISNSGMSKKQKGENEGQHVFGKRRWGDLEESNLASSGGKRVFLGDISNFVWVEVANPNGPPTPQ